MLTDRVLTAALLLPLFLAAMFLLPRLAWGALALAVVVIGCLEWRLAAMTRTGTALFACAVVVGCVFVGADLWRPAGAGVLAAAAAFWLAIVPVWLRTVRPLARPLAAAAGWLVLVSAWHAVVVLQETPLRLLALMGVVWTADIAAYFAGRRFGRRKLAPAISPGKTWEGVIGAVVAVAVYYWLLWVIAAPAGLTAHPALDGVLVAVMLALSVEGDLFESWMKRRAGVKDSGTLLPGHGGVLDRIDGVVAALPVAALLVPLMHG